MPDTVAIEGLRIDARVGVYPFEERILQLLVFDLALETDIREAAAADDVSKTIDYDRVVALVQGVVGRRHFRLIETIAEEVAAELLESLGDELRRVRIRLAKPGAVPSARTVAVEIVRGRIGTDE